MPFCVRGGDQAGESRHLAGIEVYRVQLAVERGRAGGGDREQAGPQEAPAVEIDVVRGDLAVPGSSSPL